MPASAHHPGVHPVPRTLAQRHGRALQLHLRQALLPPRALHELEHLSERASAFECFHNTQHRYSATHGRAPDESDPAGKRAPRAAEQIPTGWPKDGKVEFIRFIRSDQRLRVLGRSIPMPDTSLTEQDNLLISDTDGQLLTTARLPPPRRR